MTNHPSDAEFTRADRAIERTAKAIAGRVDKLLAEPYEWVARDYLVKGLLLALLHDHDVGALLDDLPDPGPTTLKLSNALADWRDAHPRER